MTSEHPVPPGSARRRLVAVLIGLMLLTAAVRILAAQRTYSIPNDAIKYMMGAARILEGNWDLKVSKFKKAPHPLYPALMAGAAHVTGDLEVAGRAVSITFAALTVVPLYLLCLTVLGDRSAWIPVLLYALHPRLVEFQFDILSNSVAVFFVILGFLGIAWAIRDRPGWGLGLLGLSIPLAVLARPEGVILVGVAFGVLALAVLAAWKNRDRGRIRRSLRVFGLFTGVSLLLFFSALLHPAVREKLMGQESRILGYLRSFVEMVLVEGDPTEVNLWHQIVGAWTYPFLLLTGWGFWMWWKHPDRRREKFLLVASSLFFLAVVGHYISIGYASKRYFMVPVICTLPFAAMPLEALQRRVEGRWGFQAGALCLGLLVLPLLIPTLLPRREHHRGYREAGEWILQNAGRGKRIMTRRIQVIYYAKGKRRWLPETFDDLISRGGADFAVVKVENLKPPEFDEGYHERMVREPRLERVAEFHGVEVFRFRKKRR